MVVALADVDFIFSALHFLLHFSVRFRNNISFAFEAPAVALTLN